jgi:hypothetical protein
MTRRPPAPPSAAHPLRPGGADLPPAVLAFLERLRRLPLGSWATAALEADGVDTIAALSDVPVTRDDGSEARRRLRVIVDGMPGVAAQTRRRVHDLVAVANGFVHPAIVARMKKSALTAALALVARPRLGDEDFHELYAPFATLVPLRSLAQRSPASAAAAAESRAAERIAERAADTAAGAAHDG